ncbi:tRNA (adenosine(37)-N6)-threonylcarbamoyltransferase complex ATPase subunit type 1 TsaE [Candidatus Wolfebacteria bacterium]|nr:tRNA (adenosine(37)-N6)-threonylcarbamoyltransferase complex ATPase subunit type 1 TsaE [Candidatus Wolfebacteria bacterium]
MVYELKSFKATKKLAFILAQEISRARIVSKSSLIFALSGDLGAGKTTFTQGFMRGLGIRKKIISPTFVLAKRYGIKSKFYKNIYHIDCYRLKNFKDISGLGLKEIFNNPQNIILIEWPERIKRLLPKNIIKIKFRYGEKENERIIKIMNPVKD